MPNRVIYSFIASDKFSAAARRIARGTQKIRIQFKRLGPAAKSAGLAVKGAFAGMSRAARAFTASMGPLLVGFAGIAGVMKTFSLGTGFETTMADLSAITGATGKNLDFLKEQSLTLGKASKIMASDVVEGFKLVASAKPELLKNNAALTATTKEVLLLANATGLDLATATNSAIKSLNAFEQGADQANRFVNVLAAGSKFGASAVAETTEALRRVAPVANLAGVTFETTNAALQVLALNSVDASQAGTGLSSNLLRLNKQLPGGIKAFGGLAGALEFVAAQNFDLTQMQELFGEEMVRTGGILVNNVHLLRNMETAITGTNVAEEQAAIRLATVSAKARGLGVVISNIVIRTFEELKPEIKDTLDLLDRLFRGTDPVAFARNLAGAISTMIKIVFFPLAKLIETISALRTLMTFGGDFLKDMGDIGVELSGGTSRSTTEIEMTINGPKDSVASSKSQSKGSIPAFFGLNMNTEF